MNKLAIVGAVVAVLALPVACTYMNAAGSVATAPARVVTRTMETSNIIHNYEWFFDVKGRYDSRLAQIASIAPQLEAETDPNERSRLRTEVNAMKAVCRDLANDYNANSQKANRSIFQDARVPERLDAAACETGVAA